MGLLNARKLLEDIPNKIRDAMGIIVGVNLLDEGAKNTSRSTCRRIPSVFPARASTITAAAAPGRF